jgi:hypothetical protein
MDSSQLKGVKPKRCKANGHKTRPRCTELPHTNAFVNPDDCETKNFEDIIVHNGMAIKILKMLATVMAVNQKWLKTEIPY